MLWHFVAIKCQLSQHNVQQNGKQRRNDRHLCRSPRLLSRIAAIPVITQAEHHIFIVRRELVIVATGLAVVVSLNSWNLLAMFLAVTDRHQALACYNNIGHNLLNYFHTEVLSSERSSVWTVMPPLYPDVELFSTSRLWAGAAVTVQGWRLLCYDN